MSVTDNFNRADAATLGGNWTNLNAAMQIVSNTAQGTNNGVYQWATYTAVSWNTIQSSQVTLKANTAIDDQGAICNAAGSRNGYMAMAHASVGRRLYRADGGSFTQLADYAGTVAINDTIKIGNEGSGTIRYTRNGASVGSVTDTTYTTGSPGVYATGTTGSGAVDDWIGTGEIAAGRTTKNTRGFPLGTEIGMNWQGAA